ncbi:hypothetical protein AGRA3207_001428 [Actinomadura graeca]|uniref:Uncharacterized protein n=1 Tax=Actinomadura graeca TaxID=2750812 RepID=A0ABX8QPX1_9ACTN|nr:hypothetical protein [Actinomadura graeca]QXJ20673.1 hypothetical protein AGRA3207_001428 [Actinomadura graeca]
MADPLITFTDNLVPVVGRDAYTLTVTHTIDVGEGGRRLGEAAQDLTILGTRFGLPSAEVHSAHPPPDSTATYTRRLPHVALESRLLPWETRLTWNVQKLDDKHVPWLALLLFSEHDQGGPPATGEVETGTVEQRLLTKADGVRLPSLGHTSADEKKEAVRTITVSKELFTALIPTPDELRYLAHIRSPLDQVKDPKKEDPFGQDERREAEYGFVLSSRLPVPGRCVAHLVSLEGHVGAVKDPSAITEQRIRLVSLYSWTFVCDAEQGPLFSQFRSALTKPGESDPAHLLLRHDLADSDGDAYRKHALHRLERGYVPLVHYDGAATRYAWYRGPLVPHAGRQTIAADGDRPAWTRPGTYLGTDGKYPVKETGRAAAWTLGRQLALADQDFTAAMADLLDDGSTLMRAAARLHRTPAPGGPGAHHAALRDALENPGDLHRAAFAGRLADDGFVAAVARALGAPAPDGPGGEPVAADVDELVRDGSTKSGYAVPDVYANLGGQLDDDATLTGVVTALLAPAGTAADEAPGDGVPVSPWQVVRDWLKRLRRLENVPFDHLVPTAAAVPVESLRFFHVDAAWVNALTDGALSVGVCSRATFQMLDGIRTAFYQSAEGKKVPKSGVLIRSALVTAYPRLEVGAPEATGTVRRALLAPDILLCLFDGTPSTVRLTEPFHGLHLGTESKAAVRALFARLKGEDPGPLPGPDDDPVRVSRDDPLADPHGGDHEVGLRSLVKTGSYEVGQLILDKSVTVTFRATSGSGAMVVKVGDLASSVASALKGFLPSAGLTSAGLGLQLVRSPERASLYHDVATGEDAP